MTTTHCDTCETTRANAEQQRTVDKQTLDAAAAENARTSVNMEAMRAALNSALAEREQAYAERDAATAALGSLVERAQLAPDIQHAYESGLMARAEEAESARDAAVAETSELRDVLAKSMANRITEKAAQATVERERDAALARESALRSALKRVDAECDHNYDCDRAKEWADDGTPCSCCMLDVERAIADPAQAVEEMLARVRAAIAHEAADLAEDWTCKRCDGDTAGDLAMAIRKLVAPSPRAEAEE